MKKSRYTEEQIAYVLRQAESGTPVSDVCRSIGISEATFYVWKKKYASLGVSELRRSHPRQAHPPGSHRKKALKSDAFVMDKAMAEIVSKPSVGLEEQYGVKIFSFKQPERVHSLDRWLK